MEITRYRKKIDKTDRKIAILFAKRMAIVEEIGLLKKESGIKVSDPNRELEVVANIRKSSGKYADYTEELYKKVFEISKKHQLETEEK